MSLRQWLRRRWRWFLVLTAVPTFACLASVAVGVARGDIWLFPGSRAYRPVSPREDAAMRRSRRDVYPNDVRASVSQFAQTHVAWPGIVEAFSIEHEGDGIAIHVRLQHRYFDWIEDHGSQRAHYFVSPHGEGRFSVVWPMPAAAEAPMRRELHVGDFMLAFGIPREVQGDVIVLAPTEYLDLLQRWEWLDDVLDYGRPGSPARTLRVVLF